jgi:hypothetical protein
METPNRHDLAAEALRFYPQHKHWTSTSRELVEQYT